jgi:hypothetical protein
LNPRGPKRGKSAAADLRKWILDGRDNAFDAGAHERLGARGRFARVAARFKRDVSCSTRGPLTRRKKRVHFGMGATEEFVKPFAHNFAVARDYAANHRVRLDATLAMYRQCERAADVAVIIRTTCHDK